MQVIRSIISCRYAEKDFIRLKNNTSEIKVAIKMNNNQEKIEVVEVIDESCQVV